MRDGRKYKRIEERKYKRIFVRYGAKAPEYNAVAMQISTRGLFLSTNEIVYGEGSPVVVEIKGPRETWLAQGVVRHAIKVHPNIARFTKPGMGVELVEVPPVLRDYLAAL